MSATAHNQPEALAAEGLFFYDISYKGGMTLSFIGGLCIIKYHRAAPAGSQAKQGALP